MNWLLLLNGTWESRGDATGLFTIQRRMLQTTKGDGVSKYLRAEWVLFDDRGRALFRDLTLKTVKEAAARLKPKALSARLGGRA